MMANPLHGEVSARINGRPVTLRLTLGAIAALEHESDERNFIALAERFEAGRFSTRDLLLVIAAGLRGAGKEASFSDFSDLHIEGGIPEAARIGGALLVAAFGGERRGGAQAERVS